MSLRRASTGARAAALKGSRYRVLDEDGYDALASERASERATPPPPRPSARVIEFSEDSSSVAECVCVCGIECTASVFRI